MILTNARILTFDDAERVLDSGSVEVRADGSIGSVRGGRARGADTVNAGGRLIMPALINCHSHLYSTLARGILLPGAPPADFRAILKKLWWRLDRALNIEDVYYSALIGLIDAAKNGVGTVIDHHSSPNACAGSLDAIERAYRKVGLRGATCYETGDRDGKAAAAAAIAENVRFLERRRRDDTVGGAFGLHAAFTLSDRTLRACAEANESLGGAFHIHLSEDRCDRGAVTRLNRLGILNQSTLAAHAIHVTAAERKALARSGVNVIHNPQSNCNNAVGTAALIELFRDGVMVGLGSDGYSPRLWEEFKTAANLQKVRARDPRVGCAEAYAAAFRNNRAIVRKIWGLEVGRIETGAKADLALFDYFPPTPVEPRNLLGHLLFGIANAPVDSLMVNGRWVLRDKQCVNVDERRVAEKASRRARALWERF
jgi:putative selenium metabolism protein SsnA